MSGLAPYRVASAAQPRGAATLSIIFTRREDDLGERARYLSFICARTPARWGLVVLWRPAYSGVNGPGGPVLWFYDAAQRRTAKPLEKRGSMVLFYRASRDVRTGTDARVCRDLAQNHRTIELRGGKSANSSGWRFSRRFCGSEGIKYRVDMPWASASWAIGPDQRSFAGGAARKFRGARSAWLGDRARIELGRADLKRHGFPPFFGPRIGLVGMAMLERCAKSEHRQCLSEARIEPAGLASGGQAPGGGGDRQGTPLPPPAPRAPSSLMQAQPIFLDWIDLLNLWIATDATSCQSWERENGSGLGCLPRLAGSWPRCGQSEPGERVGDRGASSGPAMRGAEWRTLWGGLPHVN